MIRTLARSMPFGSSGSFTRMMTVSFAIEQTSIGTGAGSPVVGVVSRTKGAPGTGSMNVATQAPGSGQPHVLKHVKAPWVISPPPATTTCGPPAGSAIW